MSPAPSTDDAQGADERLRAEFNDWVRAGRGASMERGHRPVGEQAIRLLEIPDDGRVLDVGCGNGWATRLMAQEASHGRVVGIDISDEMVDRSRETEVLPNVEFREASAERLPFAENEFTHAFSMESLYYYGDILRALQEIRRVLKPGGRFACVVDLYKENRPSHQWIPDLKVPVHLLSIDEYRSQFEAAGFVNVSDQRVYDSTPVPEDYAGGSFKTREDFLEYRATGSLLIMGEVAE
ncbi:MAG: class I SAM-dependent methyltransferase [Pyrinomonadaceae bacterium]